jgi:hypothetical protein
MRVLLIEAFHLIRKIAQPNRHCCGAEFCHFPVSSMILRVRDPRAHSRRALTGRREDEEEIGRAARAMLANHGANAEQEAQWRANNLLQCGGRAKPTGGGRSRSPFARWKRVVYRYGPRRMRGRVYDNPRRDRHPATP